MEILEKSGTDCQVNKVEGFLSSIAGEPNLSEKPTKIEQRLSDASEPYSLSPDGHVVGRDGFVVPKDFDEFYRLNPMGVRRWLIKRLHKRGDDDTVRDLEQELLLHLCSLPERSKYRRESANGRAEGCTDRIQCFDPVRQHGASAKRFFNYVSLCLTNRLCTILTRQAKNPLFNEQNLSITDRAPNDDRGVRSMPQREANGEYLYQHSPAARHEANNSGWHTYVQLAFIRQFRAFVEREAPHLLVVVEAVACARTLKEARDFLGLTERAFQKRRNAIDVLKDRFETGKCSRAAKGGHHIVLKMPNQPSPRSGVSGLGRSARQ
jgi:hypothetical protein